MASDSAALKEKKVNIQYSQTHFLKKRKSDSFGVFLQIGVIGLGMVGNALVKNLKREGWAHVYICQLQNISVSNKIYLSVTKYLLSVTKYICQYLFV